MTLKLISRRNILKTLGVAASATAASTILQSPAIAATDKVEWKMVTSWPKNSAGLGITAQRLADRITIMSDGRLTIKFFAAGELVPALEVFDAVSGGQAHMAHTASFFWQGKAKASVFFTTMPFGLTSLEHMAWINHGGGQSLWDDLYAPFGIKAFMAGNTGMQMGGWFKKEINSLDDLAGVKIRSAGIGGEIFKQLGAMPIFLSPNEIYTSMQTGLIDAAEFLGPWSDHGFGFYKTAPYYYWPTFNKPNGTAECLINSEALANLPTDLQAIVTNACAAENAFALSESDWQNSRYLNQLVNDKNVKLRQFSTDILDKAKILSSEIIDNVVAGDELATNILTSYRTALQNSRQWANVSSKPFISSR